MSKVRQIKEQLLISSGDNQKLIEHYKEGLKNTPEYKVKLANYYLNLGDISSAEFYTNTYTEEELKIPNNIYAKACILYKRKEYLLAQAEVQRYKKYGGEHDKYYLLKGKIFTGLGEYDKAIASFEDSRKVGGSDMEAKNNIAVVNLLKQDYVAANQILTELYRDYPNVNKVRSNYVLTLIHLKKFNLLLNVLKTHYQKSQVKSMYENLLNSNNSVSNSIQADEKMRQLSIRTTLDNYSKDRIVETTLINPLKPQLERITSNSSKTEINNKTSLTHNRFDSSHRGALYRIQVLAISNKTVAREHLQLLKNQHEEIYVHTTENWVKYSIGSFPTFKEATDYMRSINVKDAFVVNNGHSYIKVNH
ncbi:pilus assembly protein TadD [Shewanella sairae]|uniref:Pilus assembly protein TadD n=1 Tax=Shewanella sairae TaxID=190310 RepID=A0ABQ4PQG1_9GAMM|nr:pilus assembly protein TadD [Shewanella sairae]